jgi:hypothetical protein
MSEAGKRVPLFTPRRENQDRRVPVAAVVPDRLAQRESVGSGQHQVQHDHVERAFGDDVQRLASIRDGDACISLRLQMRAHELPDVRLVFDEEQLGQPRRAPGDIHGCPRLWTNL